MAAKISLRVRGDPHVALESDRVEFGTDYEALSNKPSINGVVLSGDMTLEALGVTAEAIGAVPSGGAGGIGELIAEALSEAEMADGELEDILNEDD